MGRPPKIIDLQKRHNTKSEIAKKRENEKKLGLARDHLKAPAWLRKEAKVEFERVVKETEEIGLLDNLDLTVLAIYADAYYHYTKLSKQLAREGDTVIEERRYDRILKVNPKLQAQSHYVDRIMKASTKLGMATTDRLRLIVPEKGTDKKNKFLALIRDA